MVDQRRYKFGQQMITYGDMIFNICLVRVENFHVPTLFSGLLNINFELMNKLNNSPGNKIVNPVLRFVIFARKPMMGGPIKNPINAIKERNAT